MWQFTQAGIKDPLDTLSMDEIEDYVVGWLLEGRTGEDREELKQLLTPYGDAIELTQEDELRATLLELGIPKERIELQIQTDRDAARKARERASQQRANR